MIRFSLKMIVFLTVALLLSVAGLLYAFRSHPEPLPELAPVPHLVHSRVCEGIVGDLTVPTSVSVLAVPPIVGDRDDALRRRLGREIADRFGVDVVLPEAAVERPSAVRETLRAIAEEWVPALLAESSAPTAALIARVENVRDDEAEASLLVNWTLESVSSEPRTFADGSRGSTVTKSWLDPEYARLTVLSWPRSGRAIAWLLIALGIPIVGASFCRRVLARESNGATALLLVGAAIPGIVGAWFLTGFASGALGVMGTLIAAAVAFTFCYGYLSMLEEARG